MSMNKITGRGWRILLGGLLMVSCNKYSTAPDIAGASYLRVFNDIPYTLSLINTAQVVPFFTLIIDPEFNGAGVPTGGKVIGDYLGSRQPFNTSTSSNEGNALGTSLDTTVKYNINYEYPGNAHVLTAPSINGLDLSAWAQVPSGKHRIVFIARPENYTDFSLLSDTIKKKVIIDTTIDLQQGEVYTMESVLQDVDATKYGVYLRKEDFTHSSFDMNRNYISFFNLSGRNSSASNLGISPSSGYFYDTMNVTYTCYSVNTGQVGTSGYVSSPLPEYNNLALTSLKSRMPASAPYFPLPVLPLSDFFDLQGNLRTYAGSVVTQGTGGTGTIASSVGTMPYFVFNFLSSGANIVDGSGANQQYSVICDYDPLQVNNTPSFYLGSANANLNMVIQSGGQTELYPAVYIMELVFNTAYLMQVQQKL